MKGSLALAFGLFFLYALWAAALQGALAGPAQLGEWVPDCGLVLLFPWASRLRGARGPLAALCVALARASFSVEPPAALAANALGAVGLFAALRGPFEVDRALPRACLAGLCAFLSAWLLVSARTLALSASAIETVPARLWPGALCTAFVCLLGAPFVLRLPGLAALARRRP
jgi:hypothetical protein